MAHRVDAGQNNSVREAANAVASCGQSNRPCAAGAKRSRKYNTVTDFSALAKIMLFYVALLDVAAEYVHEVWKTRRVDTFGKPIR